MIRTLRDLVMSLTATSHPQTMPSFAADPALWAELVTWAAEHALSYRDVSDWLPDMQADAIQRRVIRALTRPEDQWAFQRLAAHWDARLEAEREAAFALGVAIGANDATETAVARRSRLLADRLRELAESLELVDDLDALWSTKSLPAARRRRLAAAIGAAVCDVGEKLRAEAEALERCERLDQAGAVADRLAACTREFVAQEVMA